MKNYMKLVNILKKSRYSTISYSSKNNAKIPFLELYKKTTGEQIPKDSLPLLIKKHPNIDILSSEHLHYTLQILEKFNITAYEACRNPHLFSMNTISMDNYGEILKECGFINILPIHIIRYHTIVKRKTIEHLKKNNLIISDFVIEEALQNCFQEWPSSCKSLEKFDDSNTSILTVRMSVLQKYLHWRLGVTHEQFAKYCRFYLPLRHRPMCDIRETLDIALNDIKFNVDCIQRNGFIISSDPVNTKMILENIKTVAGLDIRDVIKIEPAILKNSATSILQIRNKLKELEISEDAQRKCLRIYCMKPQTVCERLDELQKLEDYSVLSTNPRALSMVVHKKKVMSRLNKIQDAKKQCYSFNNLVGSTKVFNTYINRFGDKVCGRDIATLINSTVYDDDNEVSRNTERVRNISKQLKKHKYWLHSALSVVNENIRFLKLKFPNDVILNHCQLLLYPISDIQYYCNNLLDLRNSGNNTFIHGSTQFETIYNNLKYCKLTDDQILSLVLYEIEKKYHFSGDGIWSRQDGIKIESLVT